MFSAVWKHWFLEILWKLNFHTVEEDWSRFSRGNRTLIVSNAIRKRVFCACLLQRKRHLIGQVKTTGISRGWGGVSNRTSERIFLSHIFSQTNDVKFWLSAVLTCQPELSVQFGLLPLMTPPAMTPTTPLLWYFIKFMYGHHFGIRCTQMTKKLSMSTF